MGAGDRFDAVDTASPRSLTHITALDGVRGLAVLLVTAYHYGFLWRPREGGLLPGGFVGVDIFFVLSGFLITSILVGERAKTGGVSFGRFYFRRSLRLLPALAVMLVVHFLYTLATEGFLVEEVKQLVFVGLYVSNFAQAYFVETMRAGLVITWSLAIEEQFYLVWPAVLLFGVFRFARSRAMVFGLILGGAVVSALIRFYLFDVVGDPVAAHVRPDARADGLLIGAACALLWRWRMVPTRPLPLVALLSALGLLAFSFLGEDGAPMYSGGFVAVAVASAAIILVVAENLGPLARIFDWSPLRFLGKVSYGIYLWHTLAFRMASHLVDSRVAHAVVGLGITAVAVAISWVVIEQPALRFKDRRAALPVQA